MATNDDLILDGIKVKEVDNKVEMAIPKDVKSAKKNKNHLFSRALFKESLHSNRLGLTVVSLGNALIMIIIIGILSTLHINSTADALKDLFSNADMENTIKSGAISFYSTFSESANAYETFIDSDDQVVTLINTCVNEVEDTKLTSGISTAKKAYDVSYALFSINATTDEQKLAAHNQAKSSTMTIVNSSLNNDTTLSTQEKKVAGDIISSYLDYYYTDKNATTTTILKSVVPSVLSDAAKEELNLDDETTVKVKDVFTNSIKRVYDDNEDKNKVAVSESFSLMKELASDDQKDFVETACSALEEKYTSDPDSYINDSSIRNQVVSDKVSSYVMQTLEDIAYYQYLPDFTVNYKTNDLGYPVELVSSGKYADNGNEIMVEIPVKSYNPDVYIKVSEKMGTTSTMLEKMHKEVITGTDYTEDEYNEAKQKAKENTVQIKEGLDAFMIEFVKRDENNSNSYYNGTSKTIDNDAIVERAVTTVSKAAETQLIDTYNSKNDVKISTIEEITVKNSSMSGESALNTVRGYAVSGISSYKDYYKTSLNKGYTQRESMLLSMNKASLGVIAQLPSTVNDSLTEMGDMNTYGIIVGVVAFGISALLIPMVYTILLAKSLVSEKVETGSLAFTLSTPTTRNSFIFTEGCYLIFSEIVMALALLLGSLLTREIGIWAGSADLTTSLPVNHILAYSLGNFMVTLAVSGICFLSSCYFNKTSQAIGVGGGLTIFFFICSILGLFATKAIPGTIRITMMNIFNYLTIDSLFDALAVMSGDWTTYFIKLSILLAITVVTYILGGFLFKKKDLPL